MALGATGEAELELSLHRENEGGSIRGAAQLPPAVSSSAFSHPTALGSFQPFTLEPKRGTATQRGLAAPPGPSGVSPPPAPVGFLPSPPWPH